MPPQSMPSSFTAFERGCNANVANSPDTLYRDRRPSSWCPLWPVNSSEMIISPGQEHSTISAPWTGGCDKRRRLDNSAQKVQDTAGAQADVRRHNLNHPLHHNVVVKEEPGISDETSECVTGPYGLSRLPYTDMDTQHRATALLASVQSYLDKILQQQPQIQSQRHQQQQYQSSWEQPPQERDLYTASRTNWQPPSIREDAYELITHGSGASRSCSTSSCASGVPISVPTPFLCSAEPPNPYSALPAAVASPARVGDHSAASTTIWRGVAPTITTGAAARPGPITTGGIGPVASGAPGSGPTSVTGAVVMTGCHLRADPGLKRRFTAALGFPSTVCNHHSAPPTTTSSAPAPSVAASTPHPASPSSIRSPVTSPSAATDAVSWPSASVPTSSVSDATNGDADDTTRPWPVTVTTATAVTSLTHIQALHASSISPTPMPTHGTHLPTDAPVITTSFSSSSLPSMSQSTSSGFSPIVKSEPVHQGATAPSTPPRSPGSRANSEPPPHVPPKPAVATSEGQPHAAGVQSGSESGAGAPKLLSFQMLGVHLSAGPPHAVHVGVEEGRAGGGAVAPRGQIVQVVLRLSPLLGSGLSDILPHAANPNRPAALQGRFQNGMLVSTASDGDTWHQQQQQPLLPPQQEQQSADLWPQVRVVSQQRQQNVEPLDRHQQHQQGACSETMGPEAVYDGTESPAVQYEAAQWQEGMDVPPSNLEFHQNLHHQYYPYKYRLSEHGFVQHQQAHIPSTAGATASPETADPLQSVSSSEAPPSSTATAICGWLPADLASEPALQGLDRLLCAAAAAAAAAAATVAEPHMPASTPALPNLQVPRIETDTFFEPDGKLQRGAVLQTACIVIRLAKLLRGGFSVSLPWCSDEDGNGGSGAIGAATAGGVTALAGGVIPSSSSNKFSCGLLGNGPQSVNAAATVSGRRTIPLATALKVLADFASAARALQQAEVRSSNFLAAATVIGGEGETSATPSWTVETQQPAVDEYKALWNLMRRGRKCAEVLMARIERDLTGDPGGVSSFNLSVSLKYAELMDTD